MTSSSIQLKQLGQDFESLPAEAVFQFKERRYDEFLISSERILHINPNNLAALLYKGIAMQEREEYQEAIACFQKVNEQCPFFPHSWFCKGECLLRTGEYDETLNAFKEFTSLNPKKSLGWCFSALTFFLMGKEALSVALLEHAYDEVEDKSQVLLCKGILEEYRGTSSEALISYIQSQMMEKDEKEVTAERIYNLVNESREK